MEDSEELDLGKGGNWLPLLIVIAGVYLISNALYTSISIYGGSYRLETQIMVILAFAAITALIAAIAYVVYSRIEPAKKLLILGMVIVIIITAIRTEVYLRSTL